MADPNVLTGIIGAAAGVVGAGYGILAGRRQKARDDDEEAEKEAAGTVASWAGLNAALDREIKRLEGALERQRAEHDSAMERQRAEYERKLDAARSRIGELETDVASLRRILGQPPK